jgi:hypothetical protein
MLWGGDEEGSEREVSVEPTPQVPLVSLTSET